MTFVNCAPFMTEQQTILTVRAMYRKEFILNTDPEKAAWWAFVESLHAAHDPLGKVSRRDLGFRALDWSIESARITTLLNRIMTKADRLWDYGSPAEGSEEFNIIIAPPTPEEVLEHGKWFMAATRQASAMAGEPVENIAIYLERECDHCDVCQAATLSLTEEIKLNEAYEASRDYWDYKVMKETKADYVWND